MAKRDYHIYDVFTDRALAGNPLAVVFDADDLDSAAMQRIAGEFNLSETVFVLPPASPHHTAALRIFTPRIELPFAGHPTVGAAIALARERSLLGEEDALLVLEERIGAVRCAVSGGGEADFAEFDLPRLPEPITAELQPEMIAAALRLPPHELGFENHKVAAWTAGVPYVAVPVRDLSAAAKAAMDVGLWLEAVPRIGGIVPSPYVYCRETVNHDCAFHARMFAPHDGIPEDPATGSAAAAFAGQVMAFDRPVDGALELWIEQGVEMGRPSRIRLGLEIRRSRLAAARIGGHAVKIAEGRLFA